MGPTNTALATPTLWPRPSLFLQGSEALLLLDAPLRAGEERDAIGDDIHESIAAARAQGFTAGAEVLADGSHRRVPPGRVGALPVKRPHQVASSGLVRLAEGRLRKSQ